MSEAVSDGRLPALRNGCFAMRPSHGLLPKKGYIPSFRYVWTFVCRGMACCYLTNIFSRFDVPTFLSRHLGMSITIMKAWYGAANNLPEATSTVCSVKRCPDNANSREASPQDCVAVRLHFDNLEHGPSCALTDIQG